MDTLHNLIKQGLEKLNISNLNTLQTKTLALNTDIIVQSPTGSGKTLAYLLPIIKHIYKHNTKFTAVIIAPTRELALQICEVSSIFCSSYCLIGNDGKRTISNANNTIKNKRQKISKQKQNYTKTGNADKSISDVNFDSRNKVNISECTFDADNHKILIATPGKLLQMLENDNKQFKSIKYLILDEGDKLLSLGFETKIAQIIAKLPKTRFTGLFTATIDDSVKKLSKLCLSNSVTIVEKEIIPQNLNIEYLKVKPFEKLSALLELIKNRKCIVFFATCAEVDYFYQLVMRLYEDDVVQNEKECVAIEHHSNIDKLDDNMAKYSNDTEEMSNNIDKCEYSAAKYNKCSTEKNSKTIEDKVNNVTESNYEKLKDKRVDKNMKLLKIHGKLKNEERQIVYKNFTENECTLFCTDIAARGIDFKCVDFVIHFDAPLDPANFIHRSGRTARNNENGKSIVFVMTNEIKFVNYLRLKKIEVKECELTYTKLQYDFISKFIDESTNKLAVIAFVAYIRSYKEYCLSYIFNLKEIDFDSTIALFFLSKVPQMKELQNIKFKRFMRIKKTNKRVKKI